MRPLDRVGSIKLKLGIVIVAAIVVTLAALLVCSWLGLPLRFGAVVAVVLALAVVQVIARGLTAPLREMARAADAMARGEHGQRVAVHGRDEVGRLAEAFNAMSAELEQTDRMRRELVANVSHELRTPLTALQATLENAIDGVEEPDRETLEVMHRQVTRLGRLVTQLLDLSRLESEGVPLDRRPFPAAALLERVRAEAMMHAPEGVDVRIEDSDGLAIDGDQERVHQVLTNLLDNALRFSPSPGTVTVLARPEGAMVRLEVLDEGPGIPPEQRTQVFERFHRVDAARSKGGAGLGLAIARWIVELHGGRIRAEERAPHGTRMVVELPGA
jgi:signal transduction histidine kinase